MVIASMLLLIFRKKTRTTLIATIRRDISDYCFYFIIKINIFCFLFDILRGKSTFMT